MPEHRTWPLVVGFCTIAFALFSPFEKVAEARLSAHMVQHLLLVAVAAPCFALAHPLSLETRRRLPPLDVKWLAVVAIVQTAVFMAWHVPVLYEAAVTHEPLHVLEHLSLIGTAF